MTTHVSARRRQALQDHAARNGNPYEAESAARLLADLPPAEPEPYEHPIVRADFVIPPTGGYGAARAEMVTAIAKAHDCTARPPALPQILIHGAGSLRGPDRVLEIEGRREAIAYLLETLPGLLAEADKAAKQDRAAFRRWLRTRPDHELEGRTEASSCRSWTADYLRAWGRAYGLRILQARTRQLTAGTAPADPAAGLLPEEPGTCSALHRATAAAQAPDISDTVDTIRRAQALPWPVDPALSGRELTRRAAPASLPPAGPEHIGARP